jgi:PBS lyase HEAT-like repeat
MLSGADQRADKIVPALIAVVRDDPDVKVKQQASWSLGRFGKKAKVAIPVLLDHFKKNPESIKSGWSVLALGEIDPLDERVFPVLIEAIQKKESDSFVVGALFNCQPRAKEIVPVLLNATQTKEFNAKPDVGIIVLLGRMGPEAKAAVATLAAIVRDKSVERPARSAAVEALGGIGSSAQEVIPDLERVKKERHAAIGQSGNYGRRTPPSVNGFIKELRSTVIGFTNPPLSLCRSPSRHTGISGPKRGRESLFRPAQNNDSRPPTPFISRADRKPALPNGAVQRL